MNEDNQHNLWVWMLQERSMTHLLIPGAGSFPHSTLMITVQKLLQRLLQRSLWFYLFPFSALSAAICLLAPTFVLQLLIGMINPKHSTLMQNLHIHIHVSIYWDIWIYVHIYFYLQYLFRLIDLRDTSPSHMLYSRDRNVYFIPWILNFYPLQNSRFSLKPYIQQLYKLIYHLLKQNFLLTSKFIMLGPISTHSKMITIKTDSLMN